MKVRIVSERSRKLARSTLVGVFALAVAFAAGGCEASNDEQVGSAESRISACIAQSTSSLDVTSATFEDDGTPYEFANYYTRNAFADDGVASGALPPPSAARVVVSGLTIQEIKNLKGWKFVKTIRNKGPKSIEIAPGVWVGCASILKFKDENGKAKYVKLDGGKCYAMTPEEERKRDQRAFWEGFWNGRWGDNIVACAVSKMGAPGIEAAKTEWYQDGIKVGEYTIAAPLIVQDSVEFTDVYELAWKQCAESFPLMGPKPSNHTLTAAELKALIARIKSILEDPKYNSAVGAELILRRMFTNRDSNVANIFFKIVDGKITPVLVLADNGAALTGTAPVTVNGLTIPIVDPAKPHVFLPGDASKQVEYSVDWKKVAADYPKLIEWLDAIANAKTNAELNELLCGMLPPDGPDGPGGRPPNSRLLDGMRKNAKDMLDFLKSKGVKVAALPSSSTPLTPVYALADVVPDSALASAVRVSPTRVPFGAAVTDTP